MVNIYYYTYYKLYQFTSKTNKGVVEWTSMIFLCTLLNMNLFSVLIYLNFENTGLVKNYGKYLGLMFFLILFITLFINYSLFLRGKRYLKIIKDYSRESKIQKVIGSVLIFLYIIFSFFFLFHVIKVI